MVPTFLAWSDGILAHYRRWIGAALSFTAAVPMLWMGDRIYATFFRPLIQVVLVILIAYTLASIVRRAAARLRDIDAFWICLAILVSYTLSLIAQPLMETLYVHNQAVQQAFEAGRIMLEGAASFVVAYGVLQRRDPHIEPETYVSGRATMA